MKHNFNDSVSVAANNNADLCQAIFSAHGQRFRRLPYAFWNMDTPPPYYPNFVTLLRANLDEKMSELRTLSGCHDGKLGVKDSFCELDLTAYGFSRLFGADWLYRDAQEADPALPYGWHKISSEDDLSNWEESWKSCGSPTDHRMFPAALLSMPDITFFGKRSGVSFDAGCIANVSENCIGLSNVFGQGLDAKTFDQAAACTATLDSAKALVGYDSGKSLKHMQKIGFQSIGKLQIWITDTAQF